MEIQKSTLHFRNSQLTYTLTAFCKIYIILFPFQNLSTGLLQLPPIKQISTSVWKKTKTKLFNSLHINDAFQHFLILEIAKLTNFTNCFPTLLQPFMNLRLSDFRRTVTACHSWKQINYENTTTFNKPT